METRTARQTPAGARPNKRRAAVLCDTDAAGRPLEGTSDRTPREMTVRSFLRRGSDKTRLIGRGILSPMRDRVPVFLGSCVMLAVLTLGACQPASVQRRGVPKASAASAEGQLGALRGSWPYRPGAQQSFYVFEQRAVLTSASDTVSRIDSVSCIPVEGSNRVGPDQLRTFPLPGRDS